MLTHSAFYVSHNDVHDVGASLSCTHTTADTDDSRFAETEKCVKACTGFIYTAWRLVDKYKQVKYKLAGLGPERACTEGL